MAVMATAGKDNLGAGFATTITNLKRKRQITILLGRLRYVMFA